MKKEPSVDLIKSEYWLETNKRVLKKQLLTWKKNVLKWKEASIGFEKEASIDLDSSGLKEIENILKVTNLKMFRKIKSLIVFWKFSKSYDMVEEVTTGQVKVYFKSVFYANLWKKTISKCWLE